MGLGEFLALSCAFVWACSVIFFRRAGETVSAFNLNLFKNSLGSLLVGITLLLWIGWRVPDPGFTTYELFLLTASGVIGITLADGFSLAALERLGAGRLAIVNCLYSPCMIGTAMIVLGETLTLWQIFGAGLVVSGVLTSTFENVTQLEEKKRVTEGWILGALSMLLMAIGIVPIKPMLERPGTLLHIVEIRLLASVAASLIWLALRGRLGAGLAEFRRPLPWRLMLIGSFLSAYMAMLLWVAGFKYAKASLVAVMNQTGTLWLLLLSCLILAEPLNRYRVFGALLGFGGVLVIVLT